MQFHRNLLLGTMLALASFPASSQDQQVSFVDGSVTPMIGWLSKNAIPLRSLEPDGNFKDLEPLKNELREVKILGLGEGTHGTQEFYQFKTRMIEFLTSELDYRVVAMEMSYPVAAEIDRYVRTGSGDLDALLTKQGLWAWDTREVKKFFEWMRAHNQGVPEERKIRFFGFDIQDNEGSVEALRKYLAITDPAKLKEVEPLFLLLHATEPGRQHFEYLGAVTSADRTRIMHDLVELLGYLELNERKFVELTSMSEFKQILWDARILAEFADMYQRPSNMRDDARDHYMADTIERIAEMFPDTKVVVWAHNIHVGVLPLRLGSLLRQKYGNSYYAMGSTFDQGGFQARTLEDSRYIGKLMNFRVNEAPSGTIEWCFRQAGIPEFIISFRGPPPPAAVKEWLQEIHSMRYVGLGYLPHSYTNWLKVSLPAVFDSIAYFKTANPSHPNPTGNREAWKIQELNQ